MHRHPLLAAAIAACALLTGNADANSPRGFVKRWCVSYTEVNHFSGRTASFELAFPSRIRAALKAAELRQQPRQHQGIEYRNIQVTAKLVPIKLRRKGWQFDRNRIELPQGVNIAVEPGFRDPHEARKEELRKKAAGAWRKRNRRKGGPVFPR